MKTRRLALLLSLVAATAGLSACGDKHDVVHEGETEGIYVDVGELKYQVQISRQLNPANVEDSGYLKGVGRFDRVLGADNVWFAVFVRVENSDKDQVARSVPVSGFELHDTQENKFSPIALSRDNVFAYRPLTVDKATTRSSGLNPLPDSPASEGPTQGALLLFKVPRLTLDNRPLELVITPPGGGEKGVITLDV
ncbi:MAG TPA: hypothetical protein VFZ89_11540 [Solirubrobacteraceae bacterium]